MLTISVRNILHIWATLGSYQNMQIFLSFSVLTNSVNLQYTILSTYLKVCNRIFTLLIFKNWKSTFSKKVNSRLAASSSYYILTFIWFIFYKIYSKINILLTLFPIKNYFRASRHKLYVLTYIKQLKENYYINRYVHKEHTTMRPLTNNLYKPICSPCSTTNAVSIIVDDHYAKCDEIRNFHWELNVVNDYEPHYSKAPLQLHLKFTDNHFTNVFITKMNKSLQHRCKYPPTVS